MISGAEVGYVAWVGDKGGGGRFKYGGGDGPDNSGHESDESTSAALFLRGLRSADRIFKSVPGKLSSPDVNNARMGPWDNEDSSESTARFTFSHLSLLFSASTSLYAFLAVAQAASFNANAVACFMRARRKKTSRIRCADAGTDGRSEPFSPRCSAQ